MESSIVPPAITGGISPPNNMNSSIVPPPTTEAEASLPPRLDSSAPPPTQIPTPHHPPYAEMITTAIRALDEKKGSSKTAIKKYIDATYSNLPPSHEALLTTHLKRLKNTGLVVMVKHSYKLPNPKKAQAASSSSSGVGSPASAPEKRGRGRPPKPKPLETGPALPKRSPGRPPKSKPVSVTVTTVGSDVKRGRGRPPKSKSIIPIPGSNGFVSKPKPRRQAKRPRPIAVPTSYGFVPPKQPRKPPTARPWFASTAGVSGSPKPRGRPRKNAVPSSGEVGASGSPRPRGRPPKNPKNVAAGVAVAPVMVLPPAPVGDSSVNAVVSGVVLNNVVSVPEKRGRGRPRKTDGPTTPKRSVGRPKKITTIPPPPPPSPPPPPVVTAAVE